MREPSYKNTATLINGCGYKITSTLFANDKKPYGWAMPMLRTYYTILYYTVPVGCVPVTS